MLLPLPGATGAPSWADPALKPRDVLSARGVACVRDFPWIPLEKGSPSGTDPGPKTKGGYLALPSSDEIKSYF